MEKMVKYLICENCRQVVASLDADKAELPITSGMFQSKHAERGERPPWMLGVSSKHLHCPMCPKRVFNEPEPRRLYVSDHIDGTDPHYLELRPMTPSEREMPEEILSVKPYKCERCGQVYSSKATYDRYHKCPKPKGEA